MASPDDAVHFCTRGRAEQSSPFHERRDEAATSVRMRRACQMIAVIRATRTHTGDMNASGYAVSGRGEVGWRSLAAGKRAKDLA